MKKINTIKDISILIYSLVIFSRSFFILLLEIINKEGFYGEISTFYKLNYYHFLIYHIILLILGIYIFKHTIKNCEKEKKKEKENEKEKKEKEKYGYIIYIIITILIQIYLRLNYVGKG